MEVEQFPAEIMELNMAIPLINEHQRPFAKSLLQQFLAKKKLSEKQWFWVKKLASEVTVAPRTPETDTVGSMQGLIDMFQTAKKHLKYPAIALQTPGGTQVRVHLAGAQSKTPGFVQVTDGGSYGNRTWFGRVSPDGVWEKSLKVTDTKVLRDVRDLLVAMSVNPAETAAAYGCLTGNCCFCGKKLTDEKSTAVGYGKTCAAHYSLPWGKSK